MNDHHPPPPDEDALTLPETWLRLVHPRRGGVPGPEIKLGKTAAGTARKLADAAREALDAMVEGTYGDRDLAGRAGRHLAGEPDPAGAAAVAAITEMASSERFPRTTFVDAWVAEHGLAFAACAAVEAAWMAPTKAMNGPWHGFRVGVVRRAANDPRDLSEAAARRVRSLLAAAGEQDHQETVERLAGYRQTPLQRAVTAYLVPDREDWVLECCTVDGPRKNRGIDTRLLMALGTPEHLAALGGRMALNWAYFSAEILATLIDGLGTDVLPVLTRTFDEGNLDSAELRRTVEAIAVLPSDAAVQALIDRFGRRHVRPALVAAARRFPKRAVRLLAPLAGDPRVDPLVTDLLRSQPWLRDADLPAQARAYVETIAASDPRVDEAPEDEVPALLAEPPWARERNAAAPVVIAGLTLPAEQSMRWAPGEKESWAAVGTSPWGRDFGEDTDWAAELEYFADGGLYTYVLPHVLMNAPEELVRPLLRDWDASQEPWNAYGAQAMKPVAARFELDMIQAATGIAKTNSVFCAELLLPYLNAEIAALMAGWLDRLKSGRQTAVAWFARHGTAAARMLLPAALGKPGRKRRVAEDALRLVADRTGAEEIVAAARTLGDRAGDAIETLLATDPLDRLPAKIPVAGDWADAALLPQVLLRERELALPPAAVRNLITMLALSRPDEVYPGVGAARDLLDPGSLAGFSWALFQRWQENGAPAADGWALSQLGWLGDDGTVRRLAPLIRAWPGESGHQKAASGLDVLAGIGTDIALMHLHAISQKVKFKGLRDRAQEKIGQLAAELDLTPEQLADRLVPDLGLDAGGGLTLDYGPRRFTIGFDEQLRPRLTDQDGTLRKALPKPAAKDDPDLAPAAYQRFAALKKDVRTVAAEQIRRLESAMLARRRWTARDFQGFFVDHPLVWHLARRLVWLGDGTPFRLAEDRTFAGADDDELKLPDDAPVGIAHPLDLGDALATWAEVFADYEILQPFPQLSRPVHALTPAERAAGDLERFEGLKVPFGKVLGLERHGWRRGVPLDAGIERWISRPVPGGLHVVIELDPGLVAAEVDMYPEQTLRHVWINDRPDDHSSPRMTAHTFGALDPVTASEVLAELTALAEAAL